MAFDPKSNLAYRQQRLQEKQVELANDPGLVFLKAMAQSAPQATFSALGQMGVNTLGYYALGGKEETQRKAFDTSSQNVQRAYERAKEYPGLYGEFERIAAEHSARFENGQPISRSKPDARGLRKSTMQKASTPAIPNVKDFGDGKYGIETSPKDFVFGLGPDGYKDPASGKLYKPITKEEFDKYSTQQRKQQEKEYLENYYSIQAKKQFGSNVEDGPISVTTANKIQEAMLKLQEDGRKKLNSFNSRISSEFKEFGGDAFLKASEQKRKEKLDAIVGVFADQIETLPPPERQAAYRNLVGQAKIAMGDEDIYAAEKRILESKNGGRVRDYGTFGDRSTNISIGEKTQTTKAIEKATIEREREATEIKRLIKKKERLVAQINKSESFKRNGDVPADLNQELLNTQKELDAAEKNYNEQNDSINFYIGEEEKGGASSHTPLTNYIDPTTGEIVRGATFSGEDKTQPESTRQKTAMARVSERFQANEKQSREDALGWALYNRPDLFEELVTANDNKGASNSEIEEIIRELSANDPNLNVFARPSESEKRKRDEEDEAIILEMMLNKDLVKGRFRTNRYVQDLGYDYDAIDGNKRQALIQIGRMSGINPDGEASRNYKQASKAYTWITPQVYSEISQDTDRNKLKFLMNNLNRKFNYRTAFEQAYQAERTK